MHARLRAMEYALMDPRTAAQTARGRCAAGAEESGPPPDQVVPLVEWGCIVLDHQPAEKHIPCAEMHGFSACRTPFPIPKAALLNPFRNPRLETWQPSAYHTIGARSEGYGHELIEPGGLHDLVVVNECDEVGSSCDGFSDQAISKRARPRTGSAT